jgi:hypothetical protein
MKMLKENRHEETSQTRRGGIKLHYQSFISH